MGAYKGMSLEEFLDRDSNKQPERNFQPNEADAAPAMTPTDQFNS